VLGYYEDASLPELEARIRAAAEEERKAEQDALRARREAAAEANPEEIDLDLDLDEDDDAPAAAPPAPAPAVTHYSIYERDHDLRTKSYGDRTVPKSTPDTVTLAPVTWEEVSATPCPQQAR